MAKHFSKQEIEEIRQQLATEAVRDTDFPETQQFNSDDTLVLVQNGVNKKIKAGNLLVGTDEVAQHDHETAVADHIIAVADHERAVETVHNVYTKDETYNRDEIASMIGGSVGMHYEIYPSTAAVVTPLPNVLYLIGPIGTGDDRYEEYVYANNAFTKIGTTSIDLSGIVDTETFNAALAGKVDKVTGKGLSTNDYTDSDKAAVASAYHKPSGGIPESDLSDSVKSKLHTTVVTGVKGAGETEYRSGNVNISKANIGLGNVVNAGQDTVPTQNSLNNITSGAVFAALADKADSDVLNGALTGVSKSGNTLSFVKGGSSVDITLDIPESLSDLSSDASHRTVTDAEKTSWNNKSSFSGNYNDLTDKPANLQTTTNLVTEVSSSSTDTQYPSAKLLYDKLSTKQDNLVSGSNIKTINGQSILGSGNITIQGGDGGSVTVDSELSSTSENPVQNKVIYTALTGKYEKPSTGIPEEDLSDAVTAKLNSGEANVIEAIQVNSVTQQITNKRVNISVPTALSALSDDASHRTITDTERTAWNGKSDFSGSFDDLSDKPSTIAGYGITDAKIQSGTITLGANSITPLTSFVETDPTVPAWAKATNKPTYTAAEVGALPSTTAIPDALADLSDDATHRTVTDAEKSTWNNKSNFSGSYDDLTDKPTIPSVPAISTDIATDKNSNIKTASPKAVYDIVNPAIVTSSPAGGFLPNRLYRLGSITGSVSFSLAAATDAAVVNHYYWTFETGSAAPTITWPSGLSWFGGSAPTVNANKHYEVSVLDNVAVFMEV